MRDDQLEAELRAALHREMAMARLGVTAPQIRTGIAARERSRRITRLAGLAVAAALVVAVAVPLVGGRISTPAGRASAVEPADVVALDTASGDLVVTRAWPDGRIEETTRYPGAADLLRQATGADVAQLPSDTVVARGPGGRLALALGSSGDTLAFPAPGGGPAPFVVAGAGANSLTWVGWASDGRLIVVGAGLIRLVNPATRGETSAALPTGVTPYWHRVDGRAVQLTWTGDGRIVARRDNSSTFSSEIGTVDVTAERPTFLVGNPTSVRVVTGLEQRRAPDGSEPTGWASSDGLRGDAAGMAALGSEETRPWVYWYLPRPGEQIADLTRAADWSSLLILTRGAGGAGARLLVADTAGSWRDAVGFSAATDGTWQFRGVAPGRRSIAVSTGGQLYVADVASGATAALPVGTLFLSWPTTSEVATEALAGLPTCSAPGGDLLATIAMSGAGSVSPASAGAPPLLGERSDTDPWRRADLASTILTDVQAGSQLVLALPPSTCVDAWLAEAVPVATDSAAPAIDLGSMSASATNSIAGLLGIHAPPVGEWIVRVKPWAQGAPSEAILLYRVNVIAAGSGETPAPPSANPTSS